MPEAERPPPRIVTWWEGLETLTQVALAFPALSVVLFAMNVGPFSQPLLRSIGYGLLEAGVLTGLLIVATVSERNKRRRR